MHRLAQRYPEAATAIIKSDPRDQRTIAIDAARCAVTHAGLKDATIAALLDGEAAGQTTNTAQRAVVGQIRDHLDEEQWNLAEAMESQTPDGEKSYLDAFMRARAAAAVWFAASPDPQEAALEAVYEACNAVRDPRVIIHLVERHEAACTDGC